MTGSIDGEREVDARGRASRCRPSCRGSARASPRTGRRCARSAGRARCRRTASWRPATSCQTSDICSMNMRKTRAARISSISVNLRSAGMPVGWPPHSRSNSGSRNRRSSVTMKRWPSRLDLDGRADRVVTEPERRARPGQLARADHGQVERRAQLAGQPGAGRAAEDLVRAPDLALELLGELRRTREVDGGDARRRARAAARARPARAARRRPPARTARRSDRRRAWRSCARPVLPERSPGRARARRHRLP